MHRASNWSVKNEISVITFIFIIQINTKVLISSFFYRCLQQERSCRYDPQFVSRIINVCATLHNFCIRNDIPLLVPNEHLGEAVDNIDNNNVGNNLLHEGRRIRQRIIDRYYLQILIYYFV